MAIQSHATTSLRSVEILAKCALASAHWGWSAGTTSRLEFAVCPIVADAGAHLSLPGPDPGSIGSVGADLQ